MEKYAVAHWRTTMTTQQEKQCFFILQNFFEKIISNNSMKRERFEILYRNVYILVCHKKIEELRRFLIENLFRVAMYTSSKVEHRRKLSFVKDVFMSLEKNSAWKNGVLSSIQKIGFLTRILSFQMRLDLLKHGFEKLYYRCFRLSFAPEKRGFLRDVAEFEKNK